MTRPTVAILGASENRGKFGNKSVRAHHKAGYEVYPVNPKGGRIEGLDVSRTLAEVPVDRLARISVYLPPNLSLAALEEMVAKPCDEVWFNPGSSNVEVLDRARELGLNVISGCSIVDLGLSPSDFP